MDPHRWRLDGQVALVTGASAGIGRAIARELLGFGADVFIVAREANALEATRAELEEEFPDRTVAALAADVADGEQRREILDWVEDHGEGLHILVNNAGTSLALLKAGVDDLATLAVFALALVLLFRWASSLAIPVAIGGAALFGLLSLAWPG